MIMDLDRKTLESLSYGTPLVYQGQIVTRSYAWDGEGGLVERVHDASDGSVTYRHAAPYTLPDDADTSMPNDWGVATYGPPSSVRFTNVELFTPTHRVTIVRGTSTEVIPVLIVDGCAYTESEWEADAPADWQLGEDGSLLFLGEIPLCDEYRMERIEG